MYPIFGFSLNSSWAPRYLTFSAESPKVPVPQCNCIGLVQSQPGPHLQTNVSQRSVGVERAAKYRIHQDYWILKDVLLFRAIWANPRKWNQKRSFFWKMSLFASRAKVEAWDCWSGRLSISSMAYISADCWDEVQARGGLGLLKWLVPDCGMHSRDTFASDHYACMASVYVIPFYQ